MGKGVSAPSIDTSGAISAFHSAADVIEREFPRALSNYEWSMSAGQRDMLDSFTEGQIQSLPFSSTAVEATNELRSFLGLKPMSGAPALQLQYNNVVDKIKAAGDAAYSGVAPFFKQWENSIEELDQMTDPEERRALKDQLKTEFSQLGDALRYDVHQVEGAPSDSSVRLYDMDTEDNPYLGVTGYQAMKDRGQLEHRDSRILNETFLDASEDLRNLSEDIDRVPDEPEKALTSTQIKEKLEDLPEYQFQLGQGTQAMERSQAARGELSSGRALIEATEFGQGLAQNVYAGHLSRLSNLAGINMPVAQQSIGNQYAQGQTQLGIGQSLGQTRQRSIQDVARSREAAFIRQGQTLYDAAKTNASMQMQAGMARQQSAAGFGKLAGTLLGGLF